MDVANGIINLSTVGDFYVFTKTTITIKKTNIILIAIKNLMAGNNLIPLLLLLLLLLLLFIL